MNALERRAVGTGKPKQGHPLHGKEIRFDKQTGEFCRGQLTPCQAKGLCGLNPDVGHHVVESHLNGWSCFRVPERGQRPERIDPYSGVNIDYRIAQKIGALQPLQTSALISRRA